MGLHGQLHDVPLADVLAVIGRRSGILALENLAGERKVALHLSAGLLTAFYDNGIPLKDGAWIRGALAVVLHSTEGNFRFSEPPEAIPENHVGLSIAHLLLDALTEAQHASECRELFPSPDTRFVLIDPSTESLDAELKGVLRSFLRMPGAIASPSDVAFLTGASLDQVLWCFHKLRIAKAIRPIRRYSDGSSPQHFSALGHPGLDTAALGRPIPSAHPSARRQSPLLSVKPAAAPAAARFLAQRFKKMAR